MNALDFIEFAERFISHPGNTTDMETETLAMGAIALARENIKLRAALKMVWERCSFHDQQHTHTWHDRADCSKTVQDALTKTAEGMT